MISSPSPSRADKSDWSKIIATLVDGRVKVECHFKFGELMKFVPGYEWDYANRCWWLPLNKTTLEMLRGIRQAQVDSAIAEAIGGTDMDGAPDPIPDDIEGIIKQMPVKIKPYNHQAAAFKRAMDIFREV